MLAVVDIFCSTWSRKSRIFPFERIDEVIKFSFMLIDILIWMHTDDDETILLNLDLEWNKTHIVESMKQNKQWREKKRMRKITFLDIKELHCKIESIAVLPINNTMRPRNRTQLRQRVFVSLPFHVFVMGCTWFCYTFSTINCLGALDGTYVKVRAPIVGKPRYRTRKGEIATNVLDVCSQDMQFMYVLPGWEGSASDSRVLRDASSRPNGFKVPTGYYYLVDAGCLLHNLIKFEMPVDPLDDEEHDPLIPPPTELGDEFIDAAETSDQWSD
ncbi:hypothetical protein HYC85_024050 [Camellia sinensis]|uniref:DDE Tnp4 domain-containing protein n=1 Tax=Camellia sinensis TaxID=4442 RepID=A0A7J7GAX9_CAMSI|nr:hypothetical protein HYC85_024050 [Camellia sinensis]